jgi:hypothetical protein
MTAYEYDHHPMGGYTDLRIRLLSKNNRGLVTNCSQLLITADHLDTRLPRLSPSVLPARFVVSLCSAKLHDDIAPRCVVAAYGIIPCHNPDEVVN